MSLPGSPTPPAGPARPRLLFDPSLCTGCRICQLVCSNHLWGGFNPARAAIAIEDRMGGLGAEAIFCRQCARPYCVMVCPVKCITADSGKAVLIDRGKCNGCGLCRDYCPWGGVSIRDGQADKCDLCSGDPECVKQCPTGALRSVGGL